MKELKVRMASTLQSDSIVDGPGIRGVLWFQGCLHNCYGCHNPESHDMSGGFLVDVESLEEDIKSLEGHDGITFSGGDPFYQPEAMLYLLKICKEIGLNTWAYSGYLYEEVLELAKEEDVYQKILENLDVLVDGKFQLANKSFECKFRGSTNQRLVDVEKSLKERKVVECSEFS